MMAGLGVNGTAGVKSATGPTVDWPQILGGEGGPVAIDPTNTRELVCEQPGREFPSTCARSSDACTPSDFGTTPVVTDADVGGDGYTMGVPAPFMVDPEDPTQLLIGTCRVWRGPANGVGWSATNAVSPILDQQASTGPCSGNSLIRSLAAMQIAGGGEVVYVGMYGALDGGGNAAGHVFSATYTSASGWSCMGGFDQQSGDRSRRCWRDQYCTSSIFQAFRSIRTIRAGRRFMRRWRDFQVRARSVDTIYRSTNGGASWLEFNR